MKYTPHAYQSRASQFIVDNRYCALFLDMGLGKTVSTLTALDRLQNDYLEVGKALVIAPKSVARNTWSAETSKWDHLQHLRLSIVMGTADQRRKALETDADIYVINRDNTKWLVDQCKNEPWPFDTIVLDESSSFKNPSSQRFKALRKIRPQVRRLIELTGTPSPNGMMDLWSQIWLLDRGERLGRTLTDYRREFFMAGRRNGAVVYDWAPKAGAREAITAKISDICLSMQASDYLEMPMVIDGGMTLQLDRIKAYRRFQRDCVTECADGQEITALTAVSLTNKLLQYASGAVYDGEHEWHEVSSSKLEALADLLEQTNGPVLVYYNYQHERERIMERHPEAVPFRGEPDILRRWNAGEIGVLLCHPASVAYGLNMQAGGHIIVWYSPTWNLEHYQQANARLIRQGQTRPVILYHLICAGTMDETVMAALRGKGNTQAALLAHIKQLMTE